MDEDILDVNSLLKLTIPQVTVGVNSAEVMALEALFRVTIKL